MGEVLTSESPEKAGRMSKVTATVVVGEGDGAVSTTDTRLGSTAAASPTWHAKAAGTQV